MRRWRREGEGYNIKGMKIAQEFLEEDVAALLIDLPNLIIAER